MSAPTNSPVAGLYNIITLDRLYLERQQDGRIKAVSQDIFSSSNLVRLLGFVSMPEHQVLIHYVYSGLLFQGETQRTKYFVPPMALL